MSKVEIKLFLALTFLTGSVAFCQTQLIAFKSHSGTMQAFVLSPDDDFGIAPQYSLESIVKLKNEQVVKVSTDRYARGAGDSSEYLYDTISKGKLGKQNWQNIYFDPKISKDSLQKLHHGIKLIGFDEQTVEPVKKQEPVAKPKKEEFAGLADNQDSQGPGGTFMLAVATILLFISLVVFTLKNKLNKLIGLEQNA